MELSQEQLKAFITRAVKLIQEELRIKKTIPIRVCVIFSGEWDERYKLFFEDSSFVDPCEFIGIVTQDQLDDPKFLSLITSRCKEVVLREEALRNDLMEDLTVFPVMNRAILAKAALCIPDIFEVIWVQKTLEHGRKLRILSSGLEHFTGKEPERYQAQILSYIQTLIEFGIDIKLDGGER